MVCKSDVYHAVESRDGSSAGDAGDSVLSVRTVSECWFVMVTTLHVNTVELEWAVWWRWYLLWDGSIGVGEGRESDVCDSVGMTMIMKMVVVGQHGFVVGEGSACRCRVCKVDDGDVYGKVGKGKVYRQRQ